MSKAPKIEIKNEEGIFGTKTNQDKTPIQKVIKDGKKVAEIKNVEGFLGTKINEDGSPIKKIVLVYGTYSYSKPNASCGSIQLDDSLAGNSIAYVAFTNSVFGGYACRQFLSRIFSILCGSKILEFSRYFCNNMSSPDRMLWAYGPSKRDTMVLAIEPHSED